MAFYESEAVTLKSYNTLRDLLRRESYLHQLDHSLADQWLKRAEAAESKLAQIEKMGWQLARGEV
jgi:hypothetical protein